MKTQAMSTKCSFVTAYGVGTNLTPLVHTEDNVGIRNFARRLNIKSGDALVLTPALSGNSFRGMWRDLLAIDLMQQLKTSRIKDSLFVVFFSGGQLQSEKGEGKEKRQKEKTAESKKLYELFPSLSLMGFSYGNLMYPSKVGVDFAIPLVSETLAYAKSVYPTLEFPASQQSVKGITAMTMMSAKKDDEKAQVLELELMKEERKATDSKERSVQMRYYVEYIVPNVNFVHGFRSLYPLSELEFGALLKVLSLSSGRSFGGLGSKGFGRMNWTYTLEVKDAPNAKAATCTVQLGNTLAIDPALQRMLDAYDKHVGTLPEIIKNDDVLKGMIK
jgi:hypothetical protein